MATAPPHVVVLAGGESTRVATGGPKALLDLAGRPVLGHVLAAAEGLEAASRTLVVGTAHRQALEAWLAASPHAGWQLVLQPEPRGTGDAVRCALASLPREGRVLVTCGDTPLLGTGTLRRLAEVPDGALLTAVLPAPSGYGRVIRDEEGALTGIVEEADATAGQRALHEVNAGVYCLDLAALRRAVEDLDAGNAQGEFYLTDAALEVLAETGGISLILEEGGDEILGVNTLADLALASMILRDRILEAHMAAGVIVDDPRSTWIEEGVEIGRGTRLMPFTVLRLGVRIGRGCTVGPFAHLRGGTVLEDGAEIGNFVEVKNGRLGPGSKAKHLTYLGDVEVGPHANIGAGTITANYDGRAKHRTEIGERAFVGSGTILIAPVKVGARAVTGAGAVVTRGRDVPEDATVAGVPARLLAPPPPKD